MCLVTEPRAAATGPDRQALEQVAALGFFLEEFDLWFPLQMLNDNQNSLYLKMQLFQSPPVSKWGGLGRGRVT